jgi:hypothetical protein
MRRPPLDAIWVASASSGSADDLRFGFVRAPTTLGGGVGGRGHVLAQRVLHGPDMISPPADYPLDIKAGVQHLHGATR